MSQVFADARVLSSGAGVRPSSSVVSSKIGLTEMFVDERSWEEVAAKTGETLSACRIGEDDDDENDDDDNDDNDEDEGEPKESGNDGVKTREDRTVGGGVVTARMVPGS